MKLPRYKLTTRTPSRFLVLLSTPILLFLSIVPDMTQAHDSDSERHRLDERFHNVENRLGEGLENLGNTQAEILDMIREINDRVTKNKNLYSRRIKGIDRNRERSKSNTSWLLKVIDPQLRNAQRRIRKNTIHRVTSAHNSKTLVTTAMPNSISTRVVSCTPGDAVVGVAHSFPTPADLSIIESAPQASGGNVWDVKVNNLDSVPHVIRLTPICMDRDG